MSLRGEGDGDAVAVAVPVPEAAGGAVVVFLAPLTPQAARIEARLIAPAPAPATLNRSRRDIRRWVRPRQSAGSISNRPGRSSCSFTTGLPPPPHSASRPPRPRTCARGATAGGPAPPPGGRCPRRGSARRP